MTPFYSKYSWIRDQNVKLTECNLHELSHQIFVFFRHFLLSIEVFFVFTCSIKIIMNSIGWFYLIFVYRLSIPFNLQMSCKSGIYLIFERRKSAWNINFHKKYLQHQNTIIWLESFFSSQKINGNCSILIIDDSRISSISLVPSCSIHILFFLFLFEKLCFFCLSVVLTYFC